MKLHPIFLSFASSAALLALTLSANASPSTGAKSAPAMTSKMSPTTTVKMSTPGATAKSSSTSAAKTRAHHVMHRGLSHKQTARISKTSAAHAKTGSKMAVKS